MASNFFSGLQNKLANDLNTSKVPSQYQFNNLTSNTGAVPEQYKFDNINKPLFGDYDLGGQNAGKNTLNNNSNKTKLANALAAMPKFSTGSTGSTSQLQFTVTPSRVDYSQYMGLSPITQRYLYGGM